jgi:hypothetical protein
MCIWDPDYRYELKNNSPNPPLALPVTVLNNNPIIRQLECGIDLDWNVPIGCPLATLSSIPTSGSTNRIGTRYITPVTPAAATDRTMALGTSRWGCWTSSHMEATCSCQLTWTRARNELRSHTDHAVTSERVRRLKKTHKEGPSSWPPTRRCIVMRKDIFATPPGVCHCEKSHHNDNHAGRRPYDFFSMSTVLCASRV